MPIDNGHLILSDAEKEVMISEDPGAIQFIRPYTGGEEFINRTKRWCLWLKDVDPTKIRASKAVMERITLTKNFRLSSGREATNKLAERPSLFGEIRQSSDSYILVPKVSSETRRYIPIGIIDADIIASGSCLIIPHANLYVLGIMTSVMQMVWMKNVCGRMKSDYQYSASIVYNNFPWPKTPSPKAVAAVEAAAQAVLDARALFPTSSLADLYNPLSMPPALARAHETLDRAVDKAYGGTFASEAKRMEFLFGLYEEYVAGLFAGMKKTTRSNS